MTKIAVWSAIIAAAVFASSNGTAAPVVSPAAGTDIVLGLRAQPQGQWQLEYRKEAPDQPAEIVSLGISPDYHYIERGGDTRLYDFGLHRVFEIRPDQHFTNNSLFAEVWFRVSEIENRAAIGGAMAAMEKAAPETKVSPLVQVPSVRAFWAETELGATTARFPRPELKRVEDGGRTRWLLADDEVVAVRYGKQAIPDAIKGNLRRLWPTVVQIHPQITDELVMSGRMPEELWIKTQPFNKDAFVAHWTLTRARWVAKAAYPLPPHVNADPVQPAGAFPEIFATLSTDVAEKKVPPAQAEYLTRMQTALKNGAGLEALLWGVELNLASGVRATPCARDDTRPFCPLLAQAGPLVQADPRASMAFAQKSPDMTDRPQFDNLPNAYLLRLLWATHPPGKDVQRAGTERDLLAALRASPIANFCKDTGDFYAMGWDAYSAWQAYDLGRLMAGHVSGDLLSDIDTLETRLATDKKEFF